MSLRYPCISSVSVYLLVIQVELFGIRLSLRDRCTISASLRESFMSSVKFYLLGIRVSVRDPFITPDSLYLFGILLSLRNTFISSGSEYRFVISLSLRDLFISSRSLNLFAILYLQDPFISSCQFISSVNVWLRYLCICSGSDYLFRIPISVRNPFISAVNFNSSGSVYFFGIRLSLR